MDLIDTHCHISDFRRGREQVVWRGRKAGVIKMVNVACQLKDCPKFLEEAKKHDFMWTTAGIHPTLLTQDMEADLKAVRKFAESEKKVVAIGEIGLDYYHDKFPHDVQEAFFVGQLNIARDLGLPAIIHCRAGKNPGENETAFTDLIKILMRENFSNGVVHCFSGNMIEAEKLLDLGLMIGFTGIITYLNNEELRKVVKMVPLDRMLLETDCPYLTIESRKGRPGEPANLVEIAKTVAKVKGVPVEEVAKITTANAERLFGI